VEQQQRAGYKKKGTVLGNFDWEEGSKISINLKN